MKEYKVAKKGVKFLLINSKREDIKEAITMILDVKKIIEKDECLAFLYEMDETSIKDISSQLNADLDSLVYFYESPRLYDMQDVYDLLDIVTKLGIKRIYYKTNECIEKDEELIKANKRLFLGKIYDNLDMEGFIRLFLESDLNASLAAINGYMHRNTINYKLEQIKNETGLDIKKFRDAMTIYKLLS